MSLFKLKILYPFIRGNKISRSDCVLNKDTMSIYGKELDPMIEHRTQFAFKGKIEHIATVNTPNIAYPSQKFNIIIPQDSADHVIVPDTLKITFGLKLTSRNKARSVVNNLGRALVKKKCLSLVQKRLM